MMAGPFDHHPVLHHRPFADEYLLANPNLAQGAMMMLRPSERLHVGRQLLERVPRVGAAFKQRGVLSLAQVK